MWRAVRTGEGHARDRKHEVQARHFDLARAPLPVAQHTLEDLADLALAHHLQIVATERLAQVEVLAQCVTGHQDDALVIHSEHAFFHGREDGRRARAVATQLAQALLELHNRLIEDAAQLAQLVTTLDADARVQVAGRELPRSLHDLAQRSDQGVRQQCRQRHRDDEGQQQGQADTAAQGSHLPVDLSERVSHARHAAHIAADAHRHCRIHQVYAERGTMAHAATCAGGQRGQHFRSLAMILERR